MKQRSIHEHIAHLEASRSWKEGDAVVVPGSGRTGVLTGRKQRHNGMEVVWDEPMFGVTKGWVAVANLALRTSE